MAWTDQREPRELKRDAKKTFGIQHSLWFLCCLSAFVTADFLSVRRHRQIRCDDGLEAVADPDRVHLKGRGLRIDTQDDAFDRFVRAEGAGYQRPGIGLAAWDGCGGRANAGKIWSGCLALATILPSRRNVRPSVSGSAVDLPRRFPA
jgi:hypothetical protein